MTEFSSLLDEPNRTQVISDLAQLVDDAVSRQSGITGMAVKGAVTAAKKIDQDIVTKGLNRVLPDVVDELAPLWNEFKAQASPGDFGGFLSNNSSRATAALLSVADANAEKADQPALTKVYNSLRSKAEKIIAPELLALGQTLERNVN